MRGLLAALFGMLAAGLLAGAASAQARIALVIGNSDYPASLGRLENTRGDAERIANALRSVDFDVDLRRDLDQDGMERAVDAFLARLEDNPGAIAFFYYSGHGASAELRGRRTNLLVPAKERIDAFSQIPAKSLRLDALVDALETTGARAVFVVSDACRNELAIAGERGPDKGFAAISARPGMLIAYATAEGATAPDDGVFASALSEQIVRPGQDASVSFLRAMQSVAARRGGGAMPFFTPGYIPEDVCFADCASTGAAAPAPPAASGGDSDRMAQELAELRAENARLAVMSGLVSSSSEPAVVDPPAAASSGRDLVLPSVEGRAPGETFRDCEVCPEMVVVPAGSFTMGSPASEAGRDSDEGPQRTVRIGAFAAGRFEVTWNEWNACVSDGGCDGYRPSDEGWGQGTRPAVNVSWNDAQAYVRWLNSQPGVSGYRLLSEAEWEYTARAGTTSAYWWGSSASHEYANYGADSCCSGLASGRDQWVNTSPAGSFPANAFGLHDLHGNVWEWVQDCYVDSYSGAPTDGSAVTTGNCSYRVFRGGSWFGGALYLRSADRVGYVPAVRVDSVGFRLARTL